MRILIIGLALIIVSIYPIYFMAQEIVIELYLNSKYKIDFVPINLKILKTPERQGTIASSYVDEHNIEFMAEDIESSTPLNVKEFRYVNVSIKMDGKGISTPIKQELSVYDSKNTHFTSWNNIYRLQTVKNQQKEIAIIQTLTGGTLTENQKWRVIYIKDDGQINEEVFSYTERGNHLLGVQLLRNSPTYIGFKSNIMMTYPTLIFPLLYPIVTFLLGILLVIIQSIRLLIKRNAT